MLKRFKKQLLKHACLLATLFLVGKASAQQAGTKNGALAAIHYAILRDSSYSFNDVLTKTNLHFVDSGFLQPAVSSTWWLKISLTNIAGITGQYNMFVEPGTYNTAYYFDANAQKWLSHSAGALQLPTTVRQQQGAMPFILNNQPVTTVYVKLNVDAIKHIQRAFRPRIQFEESRETDNHQDALLYGWVAALAVLFFFFLYNLYLYFSFKDLSVLFYLIAQAGAMIYITGYRNIFQLFSINKAFSLSLRPNNVINFYSIDSLLQHVGVMLVMFGLVQLTRSYLNTKVFLPWPNRLLKYGLYIYLPVSCVLIVINSLFFYIDEYSLLYDNLFLLLLISLIIYTCVAGYRRKLRAAGPFLLANVLPLIFMVLVTLFHIFISMATANDVWLPTLAIVSQAFCFSVALVTRTRLIQAELSARQTEAQQLAFEMQKINASMQLEKARGELLKERLDANQRELASTTLYMVQKNEMLANLKSQIEELNRLYPKHPHNKLSGMESILKSSINLDDDWQKFKLHFEQVNPGFFENLIAKYPTLTKNEVRLYAYFHINLSPKEIASLLNIEPDSVRRAKSRLYKKMGLADTQEQPLNLTED